MIAIVIATLLAVYSVVFTVKYRKTVQEKDKEEKEREQKERTRKIIEGMREAAKEREKKALEQVEKSYKAKCLEVEAKIFRVQQEEEEKLQKTRKKYEEVLESLKLTNDAKKQSLEQELAEVSSKLSEAKSAYAAYLSSRVTSDNTEFYRMELSATDIADIQNLRDTQASFSRKDVIDKLIWEIFYKPAYDKLMSHLNLAPSNKTCGIYKITNIDTGESYVGQSVDIRERLRSHIKSSLSFTIASNKLYQAMRKLGPENFTFEILELCSKDKLNEREVYWIDFFDTKNKGLNGTKGGS